MNKIINMQAKEQTNISTFLSNMLVYDDNLLYLIS